MECCDGEAHLFRNVMKDGFPQSKALELWFFSSGLVRAQPSKGCVWAGLGQSHSWEIPHRDHPKWGCALVLKYLSYCFWPPPFLSANDARDRVQPQETVSAPGGSADAETEN